MAEVITLVLDGQTVNLVPTRGALEKLSAKYQHMNAVLELLISNNFNVAVDVIFFGVEKSVNPDIEKVKDAVFAVGLATLQDTLVDYILLLMNGGKRPSKEVGDTTNPEA